MEFGFLFWLFGVGIVVATCQDLKRREVDNWLNLFLIFSSLVFVFYGALLDKEFGVILHMGFLLLVMWVVMNLFYYGRVFAGGDAKLLFAMSAFFLGVSFVESITNVGVFLLFLMIAGSFYGLVYSGVLWYLNRERVNKEIVKQVSVHRFRVLGFVVFGVVFMVLGFVNFIFLLVGLCLGIFPFLFVFAKGLENVSMIRKIPGSKLREGDWLVEDVRVGRKVIEANWDGLSLEDIRLLKKKREVLIKEGLPFVPAFLIAFLGYGIFRGWFLGLFGF
jgi:Flp pilus assembly protein protease CpaA